MRRFIERSLTGRCAHVASAGSVEDAETLMAQQYFDLVILDIALPGKSGVEWLHLLRERGFSGDVVLITAYADLETAINALRAGRVRLLAQTVFGGADAQRREALL